MKTQRKKGLCPPPATTLSCPFYQRILKFRALCFLRQRGTDLRRFALEFSGAAERLGYNDGALKDLFNSVLDEPLYWWRMRELDHLMFGEFVDFLASSPVKEAAVAADVAAMPPEVLVPAPLVVAVETAASPVVAVEAAAPLEAADNAAAPHSRKQRRRKKTSSSLQVSEVVPELTADRGVVLALTKLLALPAPPRLLALPVPSRLLALPVPSWLLALPAPSKVLAPPKLDPPDAALSAHDPSDAAVSAHDPPDAALSAHDPSNAALSAHDPPDAAVSAHDRPDAAVPARYSPEVAMAAPALELCTCPVTARVVVKITIITSRVERWEDYFP
ncbi:SH3 domain-containing -like protein [Labeo rohita]|uniref:SH3 domain-containing-like protein n=1 Tax=Labeo rohita TaxID=84645 RepID=A0A498M502_LABRO|nr:SH3 domain-containing -like protein [Labeo rohita]